tara:strand:+ start:948 stop:2033 length:1086 start_codon:yes stop_codon:yes gene_type:complete
MSLNFPTTFWKNQKTPEEETPPAVGSISINWNKKLFYSPYGTQDSQVSGPSNVVFNRNYDGNGQNGNGPFEPNPGGEIFYNNYNDNDVAYPENGDTTNQNRPYFGWYLRGNNTYSNTFHRNDPWTIQDDGRHIRLFTEADWSTLSYINYELAFSDAHPEGSSDEFYYSNRFYNGFVQSGAATGEFTLEGTGKTLRVYVSGLAEKFGAPDFYNAGTTEVVSGILEYTYDLSILKIKEQGSDPEVICSGRNISTGAGQDYPYGYPWDMNHTLFYDKDGNQKPQRYYERENLGDSINFSNQLGDGTYENVVDQTKRQDYVREVSQYTGSYSLAAGNHEIHFGFITQDGSYNSGGFIGATFEFIP